jgi:predicted metal-dependent peptidase
VPRRGRAHGGLPRRCTPHVGSQRLEGHLAACPHCSEYLAQLRVVIDVSGDVTPDDLDAEMLDELVDLYRQWRSG